MIRLTVLASGSGSNMQSIVNACNFGILKGLAAVVLVISNNADALVLERAKKEGIKSVCIDRKNFKDEESFNEAILCEIRCVKTNLICLAGYLKMIGRSVLREYSGRVLNIHPALLPKFGGKGMYGHFVHEAVVKAGEKKSGATVHFADEKYDSGRIILQREIAISDEDAPADVAKKVLGIEHQLYPQAIKKVIEENLRG